MNVSFKKGIRGDIAITLTSCRWGRTRCTRCRQQCAVRGGCWCGSRSCRNCSNRSPWDPCRSAPCPRPTRPSTARRISGTRRGVLRWCAVKNTNASIRRNSTNEMSLTRVTLSTAPFNRSYEGMTYGPEKGVLNRRQRQHVPRCSTVPRQWSRCRGAAAGARRTTPRRGNCDGARRASSWARLQCRSRSTSARRPKTAVSTHLWARDRSVQLR